MQLPDVEVAALSQPVAAARAPARGPAAAGGAGGRGRGAPAARERGAKTGVAYSSAGGGRFGAEAPYCGVGILYVRDKNGCVVTGIEAGSTAEAIGCIAVGDYLWQCDGNEVKALSNDAIRSLLKGPVGTKVELTILQRRNNWAPLRISLARFPSRTGAFQPTRLPSRAPHGAAPSTPSFSHAAVASTATALADGGKEEITQSRDGAATEGQVSERAAQAAFCARTSRRFLPTAASFASTTSTPRHAAEPAAPAAAPPPPPAGSKAHFASALQRGLALASASRNKAAAAAAAAGARARSAASAAVAAASAAGGGAGGAREARGVGGPASSSRFSSAQQSATRARATGSGAGFSGAEYDPDDVSAWAGRGAVDTSRDSVLARELHAQLNAVNAAQGHGEQVAPNEPVPPHEPVPAAAPGTARDSAVARQLQEELVALDRAMALEAALAADAASSAPDASCPRKPAGPRGPAPPTPDMPPGRSPPARPPLAVPPSNVSPPGVATASDICSRASHAAVAANRDAGLPGAADGATPSSPAAQVSMTAPAFKVAEVGADESVLQEEGAEGEGEGEAGAGEVGLTEWYAYVDEESGDVYYYNPLTEATVWDLPPGGRVIDDEEEDAESRPAHDDDADSDGEEKAADGGWAGVGGGGEEAIEESSDDSSGWSSSEEDVTELEGVEEFGGGGLEDAGSAGRASSTAATGAAAAGAAAAGAAAAGAAAAGAAGLPPQPCA